MKKVLLVEPAFPIPPKSKNHKDFLPIGLLRIASYLRKKGCEIRLVGGIDVVEMPEIEQFKPNEIWVTSLYTYWAKYVKDAVQHYKKLFPKAKIKVGGIYASLISKDKVKEYTGCDQVIQGIIPKAEEFPPAYDLITNSNPQPIDYQIIHASRGCKRRCQFCGTWKIEPNFEYKKTIKEEVKFRKLVFYDNNFLMNPSVENILQELTELKEKKKISWCESQSGFDGRILLDKPFLGRMIKQAGFRYPRIAWDWRYEEYKDIETQINILEAAGYSSKEIYVFVLYNWDIPFKEMESKRIKCWSWKVQISDCRYRPLDQLYDDYDARKIGQTSKDYYIHENWSDAQVKQFRKNIREQNICVRHGFPFYSKRFEHKKFGKEIMRKVKELKNINDKIRFLKSIEADFWVPEDIRYP